jgi:hypothetical protein
MNLTLRAIAATAATLVFCQCTATSPRTRDAAVIVSVKDQKLGLYKSGQLVGTYKVSTSKFGVGDRPGSCCTPIGATEVVAKIGHGLPPGAVLKSRQWNGEVLPPNAPGRDPIVSRILWLSGTESSNRNAYGRFIYIHGTTEENRLGTPASYGCVRMAARDVIRLFDRIPIGAKVVIVRDPLPHSTGTSSAAPVVAQPKEKPAEQPTEETRPTDKPAPTQQPSGRPRIMLNGMVVARN